MIFQVEMIDLPPKFQDRMFDMTLTVVEKDYYVQKENMDSEEIKQNQLMMEKWLEFGTNHRIENGYMLRDVGTEVCKGIEINSPEELIEIQAFIKIPLMICTSAIDHQTPCICEYDEC